MSWSRTSRPRADEGHRTRSRRLVDAWRGFPLGRAADAVPSGAASLRAHQGRRARAHRDQPIAPAQHWFRREPHMLGRPPNTTAFKYWPHQRRLVETFIYLYEVRGIRRTEQLYALARASSRGPAARPVGEARREARDRIGQDQDDEPDHRVGVPQRRARARQRPRLRAARDPDRAGALRPRPADAGLLPRGQEPSGLLVRSRHPPRARELLEPQGLLAHDLPAEARSGGGRARGDQLPPAPPHARRRARHAADDEGGAPDRAALRGRRTRASSKPSSRRSWIASPGRAASWC